MATFKDLQDRIALDYLNRMTLTPEVKRAIKNAIRCYEAQRFWFNEASTATTTTADTAEMGIPSDFLVLDRLDIRYAGCSYKLIDLTLDEIVEMNATSVTGVPTHFTYYGDQFKLAVIPDSAYSVNCYYIKSLPELSADTDTNVWTNEAQNLIAHAATIDLLTGTLNTDDERKVRYHTTMLRTALNELNLRNNTRLTGRLRATAF